jgi:hypothetical protein
MRILILLVGILLTACGTKKIAVSDDFHIKMDKGACFGSCPVYTLEIDNNGNAVYDGRRFTQKSGKHKHKLSADQMGELSELLERINFFALQDSYRSDIADLPTVAISHTNKGLSKTVSGKDSRPKPILELQKLLENIVNQEGWVAMETTQKSKEEVEEEEEETEEPEIIEREIIIKFSSGTIISRWMKGYKEYQMYVKKPLDDNKRTWIVQYNPKLVSPQVLLHKVQSDPGVDSAEFNTKTEAR